MKRYWVLIEDEFPDEITYALCYSYEGKEDEREIVGRGTNKERLDSIAEILNKGEVNLFFYH
jgi:hypothetical protein